MCKNPKCGTHYPIHPVICTDCIEYPGGPDGTITLTWPDEAAFNEFTMQVDQQIPGGTWAVFAELGEDVLPMVDRWGNTIRADQLVKAIALREKEKCTTCPCEVAQFRMRRCYDPARLVVICDLPRSGGGM